MSKKSIFFGAIIFAVAFTSASSLAQQPAPANATTNVRGGYVGLVAGANFPTGTFGTSVAPAIGLVAGGRFAPFLGAGFYGVYHGQTSSGSIFGLNGGSGTHQIDLAAEINVFLAWVHVGMDIGASINIWSASAGPVSLGTSNYALLIGPEAGIDIPLMNSGLSIGAEMHLFFYPTLAGSQTNFQVMGVLKYWI